MRVVCGIVLLVVAALFPAEASDRFRLVTAEDAEGLERRLKIAAEDGYRALAAAQGLSVNGRMRYAVLLESTPGEATHRYAVVRTSGELDAEEGGRSVNALASQGYRIRPDTLLATPLVDWWLPDTAYDNRLLLIMERAPGGKPVRYDHLTISGTDHFDVELSARREQGYRPIAIWNRGRTLSVMLERDATGEATHGQEGEDGFRLVIGVIRQSMKGRLRDLSKEGFRILDVADQSISAPPIVLLRRGTDGNWNSRLMYEADKKIHNEKLQKKLNKRGWKGFQVASRSLTPSVIGLERPPRSPMVVEYRVVSSRRSSGLTDQLDAAVGDGFGFVALMTQADETIAVTQKVTTTPADVSVSN